MIVLKSK
jgi:hypothetical protein